MFAANRTELLEFIAAAGIDACLYTMPGATPEQWLGKRCDCKYGLRGGMVRKPDGTLVERLAGGEQTGCPELRSLYVALQQLSDTQWEELIVQAGSITHRQLHAGMGIHSISGHCLHGDHERCVYEQCACMCHGGDPATNIIST